MGRLFLIRTAAQQPGSLCTSWAHDMSFARREDSLHVFISRNNQVPEKICPMGDLTP